MTPRLLITTRCDLYWCIIQRKPSGHAVTPSPWLRDTDSNLYLHFLNCNSRCRSWASLLLWSILTSDACGACSSEHKSAAVNTLMKTASLSLGRQRQGCSHLRCATLVIGKRQVEREALMIEAMICQAFSRIYCPVSLVKPRRSGAYQVQGNRSWAQGIATRWLNQTLLCVFLLDESHILQDVHRCCGVDLVPVTVSWKEYTNQLHHCSMLLQQFLWLLF